MYKEESNSVVVRLQVGRVHGLGGHIISNLRLADYLALIADG